VAAVITSITKNQK